MPRPEGFKSNFVVGTWPPRVEPPTNSGFDAARISGADRRFQINFIARGDWFLVLGTIRTISINDACESCSWFGPRSNLNQILQASEKAAGSLRRSSPATKTTPSGPRPRGRQSSSPFACYHPLAGSGPLIWDILRRARWLWTQWGPAPKVMISAASPPILAKPRILVRLVHAAADYSGSRCCWGLSIGRWLRRWIES